MDQSQVDRLNAAQPNVLVEAFVKWRDRKRALAAEIQKIDAKLDTLEIVLLNKMQELGQDGFRAYGHSVYKSTTTSATVTDRDQLIAFIKKYDCWQFADLRANKTTAEEYAQQFKMAPPGIAINKFTNVGVRKGS